MTVDNNIKIIQLQVCLLLSTCGVWNALATLRPWSKRIIPPPSVTGDMMTVEHCTWTCAANSLCRSSNCLLPRHVSRTLWTVHWLTPNTRENLRHYGHLSSSTRNIRLISVCNGKFSNGYIISIVMATSTGAVLAYWSMIACKVWTLPVSCDHC
jgi:ABC-type nitrate/sulfonate/bicarbonate transport system permease component